MTFSWPVFIIGLTLGVLQLGVGVVIGRYLLNRDAGADRDESIDDRLAALAGRLQGILAMLSGDVGRHQVRIEQMTKDISALQASGTPDLAERVLNSLAQVSQANLELQSRFAEAESQLGEHADRIEASVGVAPAKEPIPPDKDMATISRELRDRLAEVEAEG